MENEKLVSLKRAKNDGRGDQTAPAPAEAIAPDYPWGTTLNLETAELDKLGIKEMPEVGKEFMVMARARVTRVSETADERSPKADAERCINLQITDMALE